MNKLHQSLLLKYPWYANWHQNPKHQIFHWLVMVVCICGSFSVLQIAISNTNFVEANVIESLKSIAVSKSNIPEKTKDLLNKINELHLAKAEDKAALVEQMKTLAQERKQALLSLMQTDPSEVLRNTIPTKLRAQMPTEVQGLVEESVTISGTYSWFHTDNFKNNKSTFDSYITDADNKKYTLHFKGDNPEIVTASKIKITGVLLDSEIALLPENFIATSNALSLATPTSPVKLAIILFNSVGNPAQPWTIDKIRSMVFTDPTQINGLFQESSFNHVGFIGSLRPDGDIFGYYTLSSLTPGVCPTQINANEAEAKAASDGFIKANYNVVVYAFPEANCDYAGAGGGNGISGGAYMNGTYSTQDAGIWGHELGHTIGLSHASSISCTQDGQPVPISNFCNINEYGDPWDIMGGARYTLRQFNNFHKGQAYGGWLSPANTLTLDRNTNTDGVYTIAPLETASSGIITLRIPRSNPGLQEYYYLEYRQPTGFDAGGYPVHSDGITARLSYDYTSAGYQNSRLLGLFNPAANSYDQDALLPGQTFTDPDYNIKITTQSVSAAGAVVRVQMGPISCVHHTPTVRVIYPGEVQHFPPTILNGIPGGTATYNYMIANSDSSLCPPVTFKVIAATQPGLSISSALLSETIYPGSSVVRSVNVTADPTTVPNTYYTFTLTGTDTMDATHTASELAKFRVFPATPPVVSISSPIAWMTLSGTVNVNVSSSDSDDGMRKVEFYRNQTLLDTWYENTGNIDNPVLTYNPSFPWNTKVGPNGPVNFSVKAYDYAGNSATASVAVTINNPGITLTPSELSFTALNYHNAPPPPSQTVTLTNTSSATLNWSAVGETGYCAVSPTSGSLTPGASAPATISVRSFSDTGVAGGLTTCKITFSGNADNSPQNLMLYITVTSVVPQDTTPPSASVTSPLPGIVSKNSTVTIQASAGDNVGVTKVEFYSNNTLIVINKKTKCTDTTTPYTCSWPVPNSPNKTYTLTAKAYDAAGNVGVSPVVTVTAK